MAKMEYIYEILQRTPYIHNPCRHSELCNTVKYPSTTSSIRSPCPTTFMERFYSITLMALEEQQNERLWLKTNLKLAKLWLDRQEYGQLNKILRLLQVCTNEEGEDDRLKGTHLLEVYAIEIQMLYMETKNNKKLNVISAT